MASTLPSLSMAGARTGAELARCESSPVSMSTGLWCSFEKCSSLEMCMKRVSGWPIASAAVVCAKVLTCHLARLSPGGSPFDASAAWAWSIHVPSLHSHLRVLSQGTALSIARSGSVVSVVSVLPEVPLAMCACMSSGLSVPVDSDTGTRLVSASTM